MGLTSKSKTGNSLKDENNKPIALLLALDWGLFTLATTPITSTGLTHIETYVPLLKGAAASTISCLFAVGLSSLLSTNSKMWIVFFKRSEALPGHRAFSVYLQRDPRIDADALRNRVGVFPTDPAAQNSMWYKLLKENENDPGVSYSHRVYLLCRDVAAISIILWPASLIACLLLHKAFFGALLLGGLQYVIFAVAARQNAERLVQNVLAVASIAKQKKEQNADPPPVVSSEDTTVTEALKKPRRSKKP